MIRMADSIDRSHRQKAINCEARLHGDNLNIIINPNDNYSLEQWTFEDKADFFEHVHGVRPILIIQSGGTHGV